MTRRDSMAVLDDFDRFVLRAFDTVASEPVPDRLLDLVLRLRAQDAAAQTPPKGDDTQ